MPSDAKSSKKLSGEWIQMYFPKISEDIKWALYLFLTLIAMFLHCGCVVVTQAEKGCCILGDSGPKSHTM